MESGAYLSKNKNVTVNLLCDFLMMYVHIYSHMYAFIINAIDFQLQNQ